MRRFAKVGGVKVPLLLTCLLAPAGPVVAQKVGERFRDCRDHCPEMVVVPAADSFPIGDFLPRLLVNIPSFAVGVHEITFSEWDACVRDGGCGGYRPNDEKWGRGTRPVVGVNWEHASRYADWLSEKTGKEYRLLSEAEWEYAAREGRWFRGWPWVFDLIDAKEVFERSAPGEFLDNMEKLRREANEREQCRHANAWDVNRHQVHGSNDWGPPIGCRDGYVYTAPVGTFLANRFGIHDLMGNVVEWTDDCYNPFNPKSRWYDLAPTDGGPWYSGDCSQRVVRGGSFLTMPEVLVPTWREPAPAESRYDNVGFRVARNLN